MAGKSRPNGFGSLEGGAEGSDDESGEHEDRRPPPQPRPKLLPHAKKVVARRGVEAFDFSEVLLGSNLGGGKLQGVSGGAGGAIAMKEEWLVRASLTT